MPARRGQSPSIAYDPYGVPWIGYANGKNPPEISEVKAARWDGAGWVPELADGTTGGAWTDIAVSPAGQVSVGFRKDYANDAMITIRP